MGKQKYFLYKFCSSSNLGCKTLSYIACMPCKRYMTCLNHNQYVICVQHILFSLHILYDLQDLFGLSKSGSSWILACFNEKLGYIVSDWETERLQEMLPNLEIMLIFSFPLRILRIFLRKHIPCFIQKRRL